MLKAAAKFQRPPSGWFGNTTGQWWREDYVAVLAYELYLELLCTCGEDSRLCRHPFNDGYYEVKQDVCQKQAALTRYTNENKAPLEPGQFLYAVYTRDPSEELIPLAELSSQLFDDSDDE